MEIVMAVLRYGLITTIAVEAILVGRALFVLAMEKAQPAKPAPSQE